MKPTVPEIESVVIDILSSQEAGWEFPSVQIRPETLLGADLNLTSIDVLHVLASLDMRLGRKLPFQHLVMTGGTYIEDLSVAQIAEFVHLNYERAIVSPS